MSIKELPIHPITGERALGFTKRGKVIWPVIGAAGTNANSSDSMVRRLETELHEREVFAQGIIERAEAGNRDLSDEDKGLLVETRERMESIKDQLENLDALHQMSSATRQRAQQVDANISKAHGHTRGPVEYRSAGAYTLDMYNAAMGNKKARERLELFQRDSDGGGEHTTTDGNEGIIPDPIIGPVINFIDAARPLVTALGPRPLTASSWHRPHVVQHTAVAKQSAEKDTLTTQALKVERLPVSADTYGGYANCSKQLVDFSTPSGLDMVIQDLTANYAIETEAATADALAATGTAAIDYDSSVVATITAALWRAVAKAFTVCRGQGRYFLVCSPDQMGVFGPLFPPVNPQNAQSEGFQANNFGQGVMGAVSGVSTIMSAGFTGNEAFVVCTAGVEVYEQRIGTLQVTEPSVLGVQVAYAGYFANLVIDDGAIVPLNDTNGS